MKSIKVNLFFFYLLFTFYYLIISLIGRIVFCIKANIDITLFNIFDSQIIRIDAATSAYLFLPILLIFLFNTREIRVLKLVRNYILVISILTLIIDFVSAALFTQWGEILNARALGYLAYEDGFRTIINEINFSDIFSVLMLCVSVVLISYFTILNFKIKPLNLKYLWSIALISILVLVARGGFQKIPINSGVLFENQTLDQNLSRLNKSYYLFQSMLKARDINNKFSVSETSNYTTIPCNKGPKYFKTEQPNIVYIILEGVSNEFFDSTNNEYSLQMPFLSKIRSEGVSFTNIYSSGFRTDQGLLSMYSGLPALAEFNVMKEFRAIDIKPSLFKTLKTQNYSNSFFYGGDLSFSEMKRYLINQEVDLLVGESMIKSESSKLEWGFAEDVVFDEILGHLDTIHEPFFTSILTLSTHPPFDIVEKSGSDLASEEDRYIFSANMLDEYIKNFFTKSSKKPWYKNTLFVIVSDHGTLHLKDISAEDHKRWKVPMFFYGEVLKDGYRSMIINTYGNHYDLPMTIETMLGVEQNDRYRFSRNLFCTNEDDSGYWTSMYAYGFLTEKGSLVMRSNGFNSLSNIQNEFDSLKTLSQLNSLREAIKEDVIRRNTK